MDINKIFLNNCFDKGKLKSLIAVCFTNSGAYKTLELLERLKKLGFAYSTYAGSSLGIEDLKIPPQKTKLVSQADYQMQLLQTQYQQGELTTVEHFQQVIDLWHRSSENLKQEVISHFRSTDILNPVYMMAFSGARGNISQVHQLVGMRGLMANPQGEIIDFPIRSNFREGITVTEYVISCFGARKGLVDTALRTARSGYLTRRLVDVSHHVLVSMFECGTKQGFALSELKDGAKTLYSLEDRLVGRVLWENLSLNNSLNENQTENNFLEQHRLTVPHPEQARTLPVLGYPSTGQAPDSQKVSSFAVPQLILKRNVQITASLAAKIAKIRKQVIVRSPLTCNVPNSVCQLCYGWGLLQEGLVHLGEAVGIIAAQSIGEPGTQLTMRTFHTGGVFSGGVLEGFQAPFSGRIHYPQPILGTVVRTLQGKPVYKTKATGTFWIVSDFLKKEVEINLPKASILLVKQGEFVFEKQFLVELPTDLKNQNQIFAAHELVSPREGDIYIPNIKQAGDTLNLNEQTETLSNFWLLSAKRLCYTTLHWPIPNILVDNFTSLAHNSGYFFDFGWFSSRKIEFKWKHFKQRTRHATVTLARQKQQKKKFYKQNEFSKKLKCLTPGPELTLQGGRAGYFVAGTTGTGAASSLPIQALMSPHFAQPLRGLPLGSKLRLQEYKNTQEKNSNWNCTVQPTFEHRLLNFALKTIHYSELGYFIIPENNSQLIECSQLQATCCNFLLLCNSLTQTFPALIDLKNHFHLIYFVKNSVTTTNSFEEVCFQNRAGWAFNSSICFHPKFGTSFWLSENRYRLTSSLLSKFVENHLNFLVNSNNKEISTYQPVKAHSCLFPSLVSLLPKKCSFQKKALQVDRTRSQAGKVHLVKPINKKTFLPKRVLYFPPVWITSLSNNSTTFLQSKNKRMSFLRRLVNQAYFPHLTSALRTLGVETEAKGVWQKQPGLIQFSAKFIIFNRKIKNFIKKLGSNSKGVKNRAKIGKVEAASLKKINNASKFNINEHSLVKKTVFLFSNPLTRSKQLTFRNSPSKISTVVLLKQQYEHSTQLNLLVPASAKRFFNTVQNVVAYLKQTYFNLSLSNKALCFENSILLFFVDPLKEI